MAQATGAMLLVAAFLLNRGYAGIRHDGILYAGDALAQVVAGQFHEDLYFLFGSQGKFTVLPAFYGWLIGAFGLGTGTIVGLALAFALFLIASWSLLRTIAPERLLFYCMLSIALGWTIYGGRRVFAYSEPFLTARSYAEAPVLLSLAALLSRRYVLAALAICTAVAFHPLIAVGGLAVGWVILVMADRRWLWVGLLGLVPLLVLGGLHVGPFLDMFDRYDNAWWALVQEVNIHAFILNWTLFDLGVIVFDVFCLGMLLGPENDRRLDTLIRASVIAGLGGVLASFLLVDLGRSAFFGKLQVWRTLWVMHWVAMATFPLLLDKLWNGRGDAGRVAACMLALGWMAPFSPAPAVMAVFAAALNAMRARVTISRTLVRIMLAAVLACALLIIGQAELRAIKFGALLDQPLRNVLAQGLAVNLLVLLMVVGIWRFRDTLGRWAVVASVVLLVISVSVWDQRAGWTRRMESYATGEHIWPGIIEPDAKVYWYRDLMAPWILLAHGNYYTAQQGSGAVFSRDMVIELDKRRKLTGLLDFQEQICRMMNGLNEKQTSCEPDAAAVHTLCVESAIDYIVLQSTLEGKKPLADFSTGVVENGYEKKFFLYRCSALN